MICIFFTADKKFKCLKKKTTSISSHLPHVRHNNKTKTVLHFIFNIQIKNITLCHVNWCIKTMHTSIYRINESNTSLGLYEYNIFLLHKMNNVIKVPQRIMLLVAHENGMSFWMKISEYFLKYHELYVQKKKTFKKSRRGDNFKKKKIQDKKKTNRGGNSLKIETDHMRYFF